MEYTKPVIGWREWLAFPGLNIPAIKAKIEEDLKKAMKVVVIKKPKDKDDSSSQSSSYCGSDYEQY